MLCFSFCGEADADEDEETDEDSRRCRLGRLNMDGVAGGDFDGFLDGFAQGGVGVDGGFNFLEGGLEVDGQAELGDHLGGVGADDVGAEDFAVGFTDDELHKTVGLADGGRTSAPIRPAFCLFSVLSSAG